MPDERLKSSTCLSKLFYQRKKHSAKSKPSFIVVKCSSEHTRKRSEERTSQQQCYECYKGASDNKQDHRKTTKLIRVITDSSNHVTAAVKHGVKIGWVFHRCEPSKEPPHIEQCFKYQKFGHSANDCKDELRCLRCAGVHTLIKCNESKERQSVQALVAHTQQCIEAVPHIRTP